MGLLKRLEQRLRKTWKRWQGKPELPRFYRSQERFRKRYPHYQVGLGTYGIPVVHDWDEGTTLRIGSYCSIAVSVQPAHLLIACTAPHPLLFQQGIHMETFQSRREFWAGHVSAWLGGGLTQVVYCQQHELKPKSFSYWVRRHRQAAGHVTLVPLAVQKPSATGELLLQHASGWQLALPTGVDAVWLAGLLRGMA